MKRKFCINAIYTQSDHAVRVRIVREDGSFHNCGVGLLRNARMKICDLIVATAVIVLGFGAARAQHVSFGQRLFHDKADCQFCHGIDGDGRGDPRSPGRAAEMPHFDKYAYEDTNCYGLGGKDLGTDTPRYPHWTPLTRREIEAVANYIIATFVGK